MRQRLKVKIALLKSQVSQGHFKVILGHFGITVMTENLTMTLNQTLPFLDLFWDSDDLKMFDNQTNTLFASVITITATIILVLGGIVHRAIFKLLRRIPQRPINILIYPTLVSICLSIRT